MARSILIVCVGNICRSPMAEAMLQSALPGDLVSSAGIGAMVGRPAHPRSVELMATRGLDISGHVARQIDDEIVSRSGTILTMEQSHADWISAEWPEAGDRVFRWGHKQNIDVPDPFRRNDEVFLEALELIDLGLDQWIRKFRLTDKFSSLLSPGKRIG